MENILAEGLSDSLFFILVAGGLILALVVVVVLATYLKIYLKALFSDARVSFFELIGMTLRKVRAQLIVDARISLVQAGITMLSCRELEAVYLVRRNAQDLLTNVMALITAHKAHVAVDFAMLQSHHFAGGNVISLVKALVIATRAKLPLDVDTARAIDLAGRDIIDAVNTSVNPRVIDCPGRESSADKLDAVAKDGIRLLAKGRVTVRTNIAQLIGGATEETVIARVGQAIVSAIGSRESYKDVLENPDHISKSALAGGGLAAGTAFEILSVDIADISVAGVANAANSVWRPSPTQPTWAPSCRPNRPRPTSAASRPRPSNAGPWPSPASPRCGPGSRRCGPRSSRPRPRCPWPWPKRSVAGTWASWTTTACGTSRPTPV
jgi:uncharacterized protein YqfA (UPF0365 family)